MWLKYAESPIMQGEQWDRKQVFDGYRSEYDKPRGFWITDDSEDCWRSWCVGERFNLDALTHKHEVVLDESNILILRSEHDLDDFTRQYKIVERWGPPESPTKWRKVCIDWQKVAERYDGLIITPYQWARRMYEEYSWYYTWDCASGCIWKARAIREIRLLEIDIEVAKPPAPEPEAEAA